MLSPKDISKPGHYWYHAKDGSRPVMVEIAPAEAPEPQLEVRFEGRQEWDRLADLAGEFDGPVQPSKT